MAHHPNKPTENRAHKSDETVLKTESIHTGGWTAVCSDSFKDKKNIIIIPIRNREAHLRHYLKFVSPLLEKYVEKCAVLVIEQSERKEFNKGCLLNIASEILQKTADPEFIFHQDVDTIPTEKCVATLYTRNDHDIIRITCAHSSALGGVVKMKPTVMYKSNGLPNNLWGWGIEDRIFYFRCVLKKIAMSEVYNVQQHNDTELFTILPHKSNARSYTGERAKISEYWQRHPDSPFSRPDDFVNGMDTIPTYNVVGVSRVTGSSSSCRVTIDLL